MLKKLLIPAAGLLALTLGATSLHAQTTVTRRSRNGVTTTTVVNARRTSGFTYAPAAPGATTTFTDPNTGIPLNRPPIAPSPARDGRIGVDGSVVRAIRTGQPLQMINPFAPAQYGDGSDMVRRESDDPDQRPRGFKLLAFEF